MLTPHVSFVPALADLHGDGEYKVRKDGLPAHPRQWAYPTWYPLPPPPPRSAAWAWYPPHSTLALANPPGANSIWMGSVSLGAGWGKAFRVGVSILGRLPLWARGSEGVRAQPSRWELPCGGG